MPALKPQLPPAVRHLCAAALALSVSLAPALGQTTLVSASPFAPAGGAAAAGAASAQEAYELAGSSVVGSDVLLCIFDSQAKRCEWIPVGGDAGGIHVLSYDAQNDKAVVTVSGARKELGLRKATIAALTTSSSAVVAPTRPEPRAAPGARRPQPSAAAAAHDQQEARMLVSDLLEIGVQQRKAYQEARQKAAAQPATPQPSN